MASIEDVAKLAGVSKALVSRFLNNRPGVGAENKKKIAAAIDTLHYRRNDLARSLVTQRTGSVGIILDTLTNAFHFPLIHGLEVGGQERDYRVIFCDCQSNPEIKLQYIEFLSHSRVDGLVMYGSFETDDVVISELSRSKFPYVLIENDAKGVDTNKVLVDNLGGVTMLVRHLYDRGYRRIGFFCWGMNSYAGQERYHGYLRGIAACGLAPGPVYNLDDTLTKRADIQAFITQLILAGELPEALMYGADVYAFDSLPVFERHGVRVPEDIAITGVDNDVIISHDSPTPRITTLEQPLYEMGRKAVHLLVDSLTEPALPSMTIGFQMKLIEGGSVSGLHSTV